MLNTGELKNHVIKDFNAVPDIQMFISNLVGKYLTKH